MNCYRKCIFTIWLKFWENRPQCGVLTWRKFLYWFFTGVLPYLEFRICITFTLVHLADAFIQSDLHCKLYIWSVHSCTRNRTNLVSKNTYLCATVLCTLLHHGTKTQVKYVNPGTFLLRRYFLGWFRFPIFWKCDLPIPIFADSDFLSKNYNWKHIQKKKYANIKGKWFTIKLIIQNLNFHNLD